MYYKEVRYNNINNRVNGFMILFLTWIYTFVSIVPSISFSHFIVYSVIYLVGAVVAVFSTWLILTLFWSFIFWLFDIRF